MRITGMIISGALSLLACLGTLARAQESPAKPDLRAVAQGFSFPKDASLPKKFVCNASFDGLKGEKHKTAVLTITTDTKILKLDGTDRKAAELLKDLKIGVQVEIRFAGPVTVLDGQVSGTAAEILVVPTAKK
jgi:hypothetical protein